MHPWNAARLARQSLKPPADEGRGSQIVAVLMVVAAVVVVGFAVRHLRPGSSPEDLEAASLETAVVEAGASRAPEPTAAETGDAEESTGGEAQPYYGVR